MKTLLVAALAVGLVTAVGARAEPDWAKVGQALGKEGSMQPGGVYKVSLPRSDLHVTLDEVALKPGFALGSWVAFEPMGDQAMVMGDLVLTQAEVTPVMSSLEEAGIEITALHNHLLRSTPMTLYMHVEGRGDPVKLAEALHAALALSKTPFGAAPAAAPTGPQLDVAAIDQALGAKGKDNGGVLQYAIPRKDPIHDGDMAVPPSMGTAISINFQPLAANRAAITGDFVLASSEVNPAIKALRAHGIEITALHSHMLNEEPRLFFMHFWAQDDAMALAKGLAAALAVTNVQR
jgi:biotin operon repressor